MPLNFCWADALFQVMGEKGERVVRESLLIGLKGYQVTAVAPLTAPLLGYVVQN